MITATKLAKRYGDRAAVDDLSFEVTPGTVTGFLGPNGAGKSTTMRLMLGLDHGEGATLFDGRRFTTIRHPMREIGAVLEARAFHPTRSARNHLRMLAAGSGIGYARVDEVLEMVGLADVARHKPKSFSLGMGQRLGLAQAMLGDPGTLILDEPANGLDPHGILWLRDILKSLAAEGRTVFVSSHLLPEMALMADRLVVIGRGRMIYHGDVDGFVREFTRSTVVVRSPRLSELAAALDGEDVAFEDGALRVSGVEASEVGEAAFRAGIVLHELTTETASLEAAFMTATGDDTL
ncbi:ATP-binding cassette domain-containing protein [Actinoplanes sp. CA-142083]|uniref:ATP-binding cassette domain-containing protein n=1 Tax=Actinoplanes sp. CA-142083 TaxID=3239903 RepID=UPI003D89C4DF